MTDVNARTQARQGHIGIVVVPVELPERPVPAPYLRVIASNGQMIAHSESYSDTHEARQGAVALERAVIEGSHRSGRALYAALQEMDRQDAKHGVPPLTRPDGTGPRTYPLRGLIATGLAHRALSLAEKATDATDRHAGSGDLTWWDIALEEVLEAAAEEPGTAGLQRELVQAAAVFLQWAAAIERRDDVPLRGVRA
ncbi:DUF1508 domain-containing protein [Serinicoccus sediminis]|uniref:DUF1508 domain-containing protein n=1 Tax=Serinicoccus sediminis TaxID=2306021 RepID=UPI001022244E|nr:DUF1508 domain-containing protein [Serinicoccus sediminis]